MRQLCRHSSLKYERYRPPGVNCWHLSVDGSGRALTTVDSTEVLKAPAPGYRFLTTGPVRAPPNARSASARILGLCVLDLRFHSLGILHNRQGTCRLGRHSYRRIESATETR